MMRPSPSHAAEGGAGAARRATRHSAARNRGAKAACLAASLALLLSVPPAHAETLAYQGANRWVSQPDAAPLRALIAKAKQGSTRFAVHLPDNDRALATARLEVLRDLLEKAAGKPVTLSEADTGPAAAPNTLSVNAL